MKHLVTLGKHSILVETYRTELELEILEELMCSTSESQDEDDNDYRTLVEDFLGKLTDYPIQNLTKIEKILLVWKIRALTIGDDVNVIFKCPHCGRTSQSLFSVNDLCYFGSKTYLNNFKDNLVSERKLPEIAEQIQIEDLGDLDYDDFLDLKRNPEEFFNVYRDKTSLKCSECKKEVFGNYLTYKQCLTYLSEDSFLSLAQWLNVLVYYGHLTRSDVLKMTPVQRMLEIKFFKDIKKKENDSQNF